MRVTLLTVGEYPVSNGLHASQVLPFATFLKDKGVNVSWIAFVPVEMRLKDIVCNGGAALNGMRQMAAQRKVDFKVYLFPVTIVRLYSYALRKPLVWLAGRRLLAILRGFGTGNQRHILHCRSYFAAAAALEAKRELNDLCVSFDMRSLLPPEVPLMFPSVGRYLYGGLKEWEAELLRKSDYSFLPCHKGIQVIEAEGAAPAPAYLPIAGFDEAIDRNAYNAEVREWLVGYVGGFGAWQAASVLKRVFSELKNHVPCMKFEVLTSAQLSFGDDVKVHSLPNHAVEERVREMLAMVIPGPECSGSYFPRYQMNLNCFTTKAAEALSLGVPLIVNGSIGELAEYVRRKKCGVIFSITEGQIHFEGVDLKELSTESLWADLRQAAQNCSHEFSRQSVYENYISAWRQPCETASGS